MFSHSHSIVSILKAFLYSFEKRGDPKFCKGCYADYNGISPIAAPAYQALTSSLIPVSGLALISIPVSLHLTRSPLKVLNRLYGCKVYGISSHLNHLGPLLILVDTGSDYGGSNPSLPATKYLLVDVK